jgi:hypothetical protein
LNIAETEQSVLSHQCLDRRIDQRDKLLQERSAWDRKRNADQKGVDGRFTTTDARIRLKRPYPQIKN